jgi:hypothetical protein
MRYLYTNSPDESCHEIYGVYGRPVHEYEKKGLLAKGWVQNVSELSKTEVEETEEKKDKATERKLLAESLGVAVVDEEGKPLHYKLIDSAIKEAQENEHNQG